MKFLNNRFNVRLVLLIKLSNVVVEVFSNIYVIFKLNIMMVVNLSSFGI